VTRLEHVGQLTLGPARPMTEAELQRRVITLARSLGWGVTQAAAEKQAAEAIAYGVEPPELDGLVFHPRYSLGSEPGWPDLTLIRRRDRRLIFAELKGDKGRLKPRQEAVLDLLRCLEVGRSICGEGPHPKGSEGSEERRYCCWPWIQIFVWRPADLEAGRIEEGLR